MPFLLDGNPTNSEIADAVNYLLGNFPVGNTVNPDTGQVVKPGGEVYGYIYKYMAVKYADSYDGSVGFSDSPTGKSYYGLRNSDTSAESTNPADYVWYQAAGGFGSFNLLWYIATGGRQIQFAVATSAPDTGWVQDPGSSIDLDVVTSGNIPVVAETFVGFFAPSVLQVPRTGNPLSPVFTNVNAKLYATDGGVVIPFVAAQSDSDASFVNNTWRIGNSSTTGNADISYTNITVGSPTDAGDYAQWPAPTAMSSSPAYISVPIRYKNSLGVVSQASVASIQFLFADPGAAGQDSPYVDISGYTGFSVNNSGIFSPANTTLSAVTTAITSPTYAWTITGGTPTSSTNSSVVVTPNNSVGSVTVTLSVSGTNLASPLSKTITMPVVYQGTPGQAGQNGVQSAYPQIYRWTTSSTPPARPTTTSTYTWADGSYTAPTDWYTTSPTNSTPGSFLWSITVPVTTTATTTTSTLDWTDVNYPIRAIAYNGTNGNNGNNASVLTLASTSQTFTYGQDGSASPTSQTITFTANLQNLTGTATFTATNYDVDGNVLGNPTLGGSGNTRTLTIANFDVAAYCVVSATLSGYTDQLTIIRLQDGLNTTSGYLTNESVTVQASSGGTVPSGGFNNAGGTFKVYNGTTDVTTSSAFSLVSSTGVTISINASTGVYTVTAMSADQGSATLQAVYGDVTLTKIYSIAKSKAGSSASVLTLTQTAQTFTYDGNGNASPSAQTILFTANTVNLSPTVGTPVSFTGTKYNSAGASLGAVTFTNVGVTSAELTIANFGAAAYCVVVATFSGYSDQTTIYRLSSGTDGVSPIVGFLTNEAVTLQADNAGVVASFTPGNGNFLVYEGITDVTASATFSVVSSTGITVSINSSGAYSISAMSAAYGSATFRAEYGTVTIDKIYSVAKSIAGANGSDGLNAQVLYLSATSQSFTYNSAGSASPSSQTISFTANLQNLSGTAAFTCTLYNASGSSTGTVTLGGSGNTRTLTNAQFSTAAYAVVVATLSGYSDTITVVKLQDGTNGTNGENAVVGFLTNEAVTVAADNSGTVVSFADAGGTFFVYDGLTNVTSSSTFSVASSSNVTISINSSGVYTVTAMSADQGTATLQAVYSTVTIQKVYTISKSLAGDPGSPGSATYLVTRSANDSSPPTNAEVNTAIGRDPVLGDIVTVNYNSGNNSIVYRYITSWVLQTTYITGSLIVENTITASKMSVTQLSAISQNVGDITAGSIAIGGILPSSIPVGNIWNFNGLATTANMLDVVYVTNSGLWVAVGSGGASWYRLAGSTTWTYVYTGSSLDFYSVATNGTGLVAISGSTTIIGTISGGVLSWSASTGSQRGTTTTQYRVIYVSTVNRYFTMSVTNLWYSDSNGNNWQAATNPGLAVTCTFDGALLWACGYTSGSVYYTSLTDNGSTVTVSWSTAISTGGSNGITRDFLYIGGRYILVGTAVRTSTSGAAGTWSGTTSYPGINRISYFDNLFYGVGSSSGNSVIWRSSNGFQSSVQLIDGPTQVLNAIGFGPTEGVVVGNTGTYAISQIEDSWTGSGTSINNDGAFFTGAVGGSISFDGTALTLDVPFLQNRQTITTSVTVKQNYNALSVGKVTISDTADVTVPSGSVWVIV